MAEAALDARECPVCGCEFTPDEPDQVYCSPWCERVAKEQPEAD